MLAEANGRLSRDVAGGSSACGRGRREDRRCQNHTFDNGKFWQDATGKSVEELEADWETALVRYGKFEDGMLSTTRPVGMRI